MSLLVYHYEKQVSEDLHVQRAGRWLMKTRTKNVIVHGKEHIPVNGPLLIAGNHSGMGDAVGMHGFMPRTDIYTLVYKQGILQGLTHFNRYIVVIEEQRPLDAIRKTLDHLRLGHAVLILPKGSIEVDPGLDLTGALSTLEGWSQSPVFLAKKVPGTAVLPAAIGGVIPRSALKNPLVRLYRDYDSRTFLAATLMLMFRFYQNATVSLFYGKPLKGDGITMGNIRSQMSGMLCEIHREQSQLLGPWRS